MTDSTSKEDKKPVSDPLPRLNIYDLAKNEKQFSLFVQAYSAIQNLPKDNLHSFYQIAGIHGLPFTPYDDVKGDWTPDMGRWGGYCHHGMQTFPTWHRAYVLLIENAIREQALILAKKTQVEDPKDLAPWIEAAETLRFPWWDWALRETEINGVPDILSSVKIEIFTFDSPDTKRSIANPLRAYCVPDDVGPIAASGDINNPTAKPNYEPLGVSTPFTPKGYSTIRHPTNEYVSNVDRLNLSVQRYASCVLRPGLFQVFSINNYEHFSNHSSVLISGEKIQEVSAYGHFASIEVVHDAVHDTLGGNGGHMSYPDVAAFDPIFFLHHCNVDRLFALWQAMYPHEYVTPFTTVKGGGTYTIPEYTVVDGNTPLTPFRKDKHRFWTSFEVRDTRDLGYYYPELKEKQDPKTLRKKVMEFYRPDSYTQLRWFINFPDILKGNGGGPFIIRVFLDDPKANAKTSTINIHYAGSISVFSRDSDTQCANCMVNQHMKGSIELTRTMKDLGIFINREPSSSEDPIDINNPPGSPLRPEAIKVVVSTPNNEDLPVSLAGKFNLTWVMELDTKEREELAPKFLEAHKGKLSSHPETLAPAFIGGLAKMN